MTKAQANGLAGELEGARRYPQMLASLRLLGTGPSRKRVRKQLLLHGLWL